MRACIRAIEKKNYGFNRYSSRNGGLVVKFALYIRVIYGRGAAGSGGVTFFLFLQKKIRNVEAQN